MDVNLHKGVHSKLSTALLLIAMPVLIVSCKQNSITGLEGTLSTGEAGSEISAASLVFSPTKLEFGSIAVNSDSAEQRVSLLNRSKKPMYLGATTYFKGATQLGLAEETKCV